MRMLALDIGDRRIGVAVSDPSGTIAQPVRVIERIGWGPDVRKIAALANEYGTNLVLAGLPLNMDGSEGGQAEKVRAFAGKLLEAGLEIIFADERMSTVSAERVLIESDIRRDKRKRVVDKVAAAVILQGYLDGAARERFEDLPT
ncbi:MAG: Holliday junction resolvase RuvX [Clostridia bacterium]|nr:Holliday junction resolvase RuvX [Clostridia bacterium]